MKTRVSAEAVIGGDIGPHDRPQWATRVDQDGVRYIFPYIGRIVHDNVSWLDTDAVYPEIPGCADYETETGTEVADNTYFLHEITRNGALISIFAAAPHVNEGGVALLSAQFPPTGWTYVSDKPENYDLQCDCTPEELQDMLVGLEVLRSEWRALVTKAEAAIAEARHKMQANNSAQDGYNA